MKKHRMPDTKEGGVNVTPLIDIVMCLIIFFMLVARIGVSTGAEAMAIPETILGKKIDDMGNTLTLNVRTGPGEEPFVTALVDGRSCQMVLSEGRASKTTPYLVAVLSALQKDMPYKYLEPVLSACSRANVTRVNFNTKVVTQ
jgi:biopolymer transport protein ExbD